MRLSRINLAEPRAGGAAEGEGYTKRALLQLHTLFLGLFVEPFRTCLVEIGQARLGDNVISPEDIENLSLQKGRRFWLLDRALELRLCCRVISSSGLTAGLPC